MIQNHILFSYTKSYYPDLWKVFFRSMPVKVHTMFKIYKATVIRFEIEKHLRTKPLVIQ